MELIQMHISEVLSFLAGGTIGSLLTIKFTKNRASGNGNIVDQSNAKAGGDNIAGNKTTINR